MDFISDRKRYFTGQHRYVIYGQIQILGDFIQKVQNINEIIKNMKYISISQPKSNQNIRQSLEIQKINRRNVQQTRRLILTDINLYNYNQNELRRTISTVNVYGIIMSKTSNQFVIKIKNQYDYRFKSHQRWKIYAQIINISIQFNRQKPKLYLVDDSILEQYTLTSVKDSCKMPKHCIQFDQFQKPNLMISNLLQCDHRVLYIKGNDIYEIQPYEFQGLLKLGRQTQLVFNKNLNLKLIKKSINKFKLGVSVSRVQKQLIDFKQKANKEEVEFILENPDNFLIFTKPYNYTLLQQTQNFVQFTQKQIKKILEKIIKLIIEQNLDQISIHNILFERRYQIVFTEFQRFKSRNQQRHHQQISPQQFSALPTKNKAVLFWKIGIILYRLIYGISPIPNNTVLMKQFFSKQKIFYQQFIKKRYSEEFNNLLNQLLTFNPEKRLKLLGGKQHQIYGILKHEWFTKTL